MLDFGGQMWWHFWLTAQALGRLGWWVTQFFVWRVFCLLLHKNFVFSSNHISRTCITGISRLTSFPESRWYRYLWPNRQTSFIRLSLGSASAPFINCLGALRQVVVLHPVVVFVPFGFSGDLLFFTLLHNLGDPARRTRRPSGTDLAFFFNLLSLLAIIYHFHSPRTKHSAWCNYTLHE